MIEVVRSVDLECHSEIGSGAIEFATTPCTKYDCPFEGDVVDGEDYWAAARNGPNTTQTAFLKQPQALSFVKVFQVVVGLIACGCRKCYPMASRCQFVFVDKTTELVGSSQSSKVWIADQCRTRPHR